MSGETLRNPVEPIAARAAPGTHHQAEVNR
jgi:hypothetical protein